MDSVLNYDALSEQLAGCAGDMGVQTMHMEGQLEELAEKRELAKRSASYFEILQRQNQQLQKQLQQQFSERKPDFATTAEYFQKCRQYVVDLAESKEAQQPRKPEHLFPKQEQKKAPIPEPVLLQLPEKLADLKMFSSRTPEAPAAARKSPQSTPQLSARDAVGIPRQSLIQLIELQMDQIAELERLLK